MKIFNFLKVRSLFVLGVIVIVLLTSAIGTVSAEDCEQLEKEFCDKCGEIIANAANENCERHNKYSGCALDTAGCWLSPGFSDLGGEE